MLWDPPQLDLAFCVGTEYRTQMANPPLSGDLLLGRDWGGGEVLQS